MSRVIVLVEGKTERRVCHEVFAPELGGKEIYLAATVVGPHGNTGGNNFSMVCRELCDLLKQDNGRLVTMLFDYYGLKKWPGLEFARKAPFESRPAIMERAIKSAVLADFVNLDITRFIPYVQMHEIESLLFADPAVMARIFARPDLEPEFAQIVARAGGCEQINDSSLTAPSKRIGRIFTDYKKGAGDDAHAYRILKEIGLATVREKCPNFHQWMTEIEQRSLKLGARG